MAGTGGRSKSSSHKWFQCTAGTAVLEARRWGQGGQQGRKGCKRAEGKLELLVTWKLDGRKHPPLASALGRPEPGPAKDAGNEDILGDLLQMGRGAQAPLERRSVSAAAAGTAEAPGGRRQ